MSDECIECKNGAPYPHATHMLPVPRRGPAVAAVGKAVPQEQETVRLEKYLKADAMQQMMLNPEAFPGASTFVIHLYNMVQRLQLEHLAIKRHLLQRHLMTEGELAEVLGIETGIMNDQLKKYQEQIDRAAKQAPVQVPPQQDPRRAPGA